MSFESKVLIPACILKFQFDRLFNKSLIDFENASEREIAIKTTVCMCCKLEYTEGQNLQSLEQ